MNHEVFITCALTGAGATTHKSDLVPITPEQIAESAIASAKAGAAIVHIHVRDPETGVPTRDPALYKGVVDLIRASDVDVVLNLTAGFQTLGTLMAVGLMMLPATALSLTKAETSLGVSRGLRITASATMFLVSRTRTLRAFLSPTRARRTFCGVDMLWIFFHMGAFSSSSRLHRALL